MRKLVGLIIGFVVLAVGISACSGDTIAKRLKKEKERRQRFIEENDFVILKTFPFDTVFGEKEYYEDASGVYIRVIDKGNGEMARKFKENVQSGTTVNARYADTRQLDDTTIHSNYLVSPLQFQYGMEQTYGTSNFMSIPVAKALEYVGNHGVVSLIVPSQEGSDYQKQSLYDTFFYGKLEYTFED